MKKVLIISYYFPPIGGAGVQRVLKFVKYLPKFNYNPIVLTPNSSLIRNHSYDHSLMEEIPKNTKIYTTFIFDLNWIFKILYGLKLKKIVNFINGTLLFPDYQKQWIPFAKMKIKKILKREKIDLVFITSPPHSIQILGKWIKEKFNLPVVSDYRDPFTFNYQEKSDNFFKKCFNYEKKLLNKCDMIIANTKGNRENYLEKFNISENKISVITNGFDKKDFKNIKVEREQNNKIIFSHIGQLYGDYNATPFLLALNKIKNKLNNVEFRFIGSVTPDDKKLIKKFELSNFIKLINYCSHKEALQYSKESDYLVLIQPNKKFVNYIPGKTFEYINSGKKIIAIIPENGSSAEIIRNTKTGVVVSPDNIDKIADIILDFIKNNEKDNFIPNFKEINKYERRRLTRKLANIFDNILSRGSKSV
jgi:glycosyltransferase involved in cell wall biosynthesis